MYTMSMTDTQTHSTQYSKEQHEEMFQQMKYFAARRIYKIQDNLTPSSIRTTSEKKKKTWAVWFEQRFGEPYLDYISRIKKEGHG